MCMGGPSVSAPSQPAQAAVVTPQAQPARPTGGLIDSAADKRGQQAAAGPAVSGSFDSTLLTPTGERRNPGLTSMLRAREEPQKARVASFLGAKAKKDQFDKAGTFF